jgi:membrane fusion protein, multidrug efflux system
VRTGRLRLASLAAVALLLAGCGDERRAPAPRAPLDAGAAPAGNDAAAATSRGFVGVLVAAELVDVAPRFEGRVVKVHVRAGDKVRAGALLAEMDPAPLREELRAAEASQRAAVAAQRQADVDVAEATRRLENERAAVAAGTSPRQLLETAELGLQRARAARERARSMVAEERSRVETSRARLADAALRAPFAGTVGLRFRDAGATVGPGTPIVRLVGQGDLLLRFAVPPDRARALAVGDTVDVEIETLPDPAPAIVRQISPALDPASGLVLCEAELGLDDTARAELRSGLAAWVRPR